MDVKTIQDFLPKQSFDRLSQIIFAPTFPWYLTTSVASPYLKSKENNKLFYMSHLVYEKENYFDLTPIDHHIMSFLVSAQVYLQKFTTYYDIIGEPMPKGQFLEIPKKENLLRIKINFYPIISYP